MIRSFDHSIVHRSFIVPIHRSSFVHSPYSSFFQIIFVLSLCYRHFDRSFVRSFDRSFIVLIHRSSFVHRHYSVFIGRSYDYSPLLFIITIHHYYSASYYSLLLFIDDICSNLFVVTINCYYSSIIRSRQISTTHLPCCPVHLRPARPIFQSYELR
jgi:hypothetical protein